MKTQKPIVVVGSINMDLVCRCPRMPLPGETILGNALMTIPGGKGANQAVAAARLGAPVYMVGRVGNDDFGSRLITGLESHGVNTRFITVTEGIASSCAMILVDEKGENAIVVAQGANDHLKPADIDKAEEVIAGASTVVLQLEVPLATVEYTLAMCKRLGVRTILDPAPAPAGGLSRDLLQVDILSPNQSEAEILLRKPRETGRMRRDKPIDARHLASDLLASGPRVVVLKMGSKGAMIVDGQIHEIPPFRANVVDTTAAGDAFTGALAVALGEGRTMPEAVKFGNAAGALCCEGFGAQPALPLREAVDQFILNSR